MVQNSLKIYSITRQPDDSFAIEEISDKNSIPPEFLSEISKMNKEVVLICCPLKTNEYLLFLFGRFCSIAQDSIKEIIQKVFKGSNYVLNASIGLSCFVILVVIFNDYVPLFAQSLSNSLLNKKILAFLKNFFI